MRGPNAANAIGVALRPATPDDEARLLDWRNDAETVRFSKTRRPIGPDEHHHWLTARLSSTAPRLWIAEAGGVPIGQVRLDEVRSGVGEVSIAVAPDQRGRGYGSALILAVDRAVDHDTSIRELLAVVHGDNARSLRIFERAGYAISTRRDDGFIELLRAPISAAPAPADGSNPRDRWATNVREYRDEDGRTFRYVYVSHPGTDSLVVHFSAFFGEWGDAQPYRQVFQGYFHRLKMLGDVPDHDWLFLCDEFGADGNGTYYTGERGDFFVERAMLGILQRLMAEHQKPASRTVMMGSSMGATAALKFGLMLRAKGIIAISPHIDLDICAATQGRERHVSFICPDGDSMSPANWPYTRQVRNLIETWDTSSPPPRLFLQACADDRGVYEEQVLPLRDRWQQAGGQVSLDVRRRGGHTSDHATKPLLLDATRRLLADQPIDLDAYARQPVYRATSVPSSPLKHARRLAGRARRLLRPR